MFRHYSGKNGQILLKINSFNRKNVLFFFLSVSYNPSHFSPSLLVIAVIVQYIIQFSHWLVCNIVLKFYYLTFQILQFIGNYDPTLIRFYASSFCCSTLQLSKQYSVSCHVHFIISTVMMLMTIAPAYALKFFLYPHSSLYTPTKISSKGNLFHKVIFRATMKPVNRRIRSEPTFQQSGLLVEVVAQRNMTVSTYEDQHFTPLN